MDNNLQEQLKKNRAEHACFVLGSVPLELADELTGITNPGNYDPKMPRNIRRYDLPIDSLHPFQGIPHEYLLNKRKQMLLAMRALYFAAIDLNALPQNGPLPQSCLGYSEIESLFKELRKFEIPNSPDNQEYFDNDEKADYEEDRAKLQERTIEAVKEYQDCLNQYLENLNEKLTSNQRDLFLFIKKLKTTLLESQKISFKEGDDELESPTASIEEVRAAIIKQCNHHPKLSALDWPVGDSSRVNFDTALSKFLVRVEKFLQDQEPPQQKELPCPQESSNVQVSPEAQESAISTPLHEYPNQDKKTSTPQSPTEWDELTQERIILFQKELELQPQQMLVLACLLYNEGRWVEAREIAEVDDGWNAACENPALFSKEQPSPNFNQPISRVITTLEKELGVQLKIEFEKGKKNKLKRPIQRGEGNKGLARYRIDLNNIEELPTASGEK